MYFEDTRSLHVKKANLRFLNYNIHRLVHEYLELSEKKLKKQLPTRLTDALGETKSK